MVNTYLNVTSADLFSITSIVLAKVEFGGKKHPKNPVHNAELTSDVSRTENEAIRRAKMTIPMHTKNHSGVGFAWSAFGV